MHPSVVQDEPGNCPICGMPLSKRKKGQTEALPEGVTARVQLAPFRVAQAGIRTAEVGYAPLAETSRRSAPSTFDERRLARISSKTKGMARVEKLFVNFTGTPVEAGEPLAELYSPELYQATQELLLAHAARGGAAAADRAGPVAPRRPQDLVRLAAEKLTLWGITAEQIDEILAKGKADYRLPILVADRRGRGPEERRRGPVRRRGRGDVRGRRPEPRLGPGAGLRGPDRPGPGRARRSRRPSRRSPARSSRARSPSSTRRLDPTTRTVERPL